jgi:hypothetical protein
MPKLYKLDLLRTFQPHSGRDKSKTCDPNSSSSVVPPQNPAAGVDLQCEVHSGFFINICDQRELRSSLLNRYLWLLLIPLLVLTSTNKVILFTG